eukprot:6475423-Pyramimonas_sp.AAC.1
MLRPTDSGCRDWTGQLRPSVPWDAALPFTRSAWVGIPSPLTAECLQGQGDFLPLGIDVEHSSTLCGTSSSTGPTTAA